jgi:hypothetical protein
VLKRVFKSKFRATRMRTPTARTQELLHRELHSPRFKRMADRGEASNSRLRAFDNVAVTSGIDPQKLSWGGRPRRVLSVAGPSLLAARRIKQVVTEWVQVVEKICRRRGMCFPLKSSDWNSRCRSHRARSGHQCFSAVSMCLECFQYHSRGPLL